MQLWRKVLKADIYLYGCNYMFQMVGIRLKTDKLILRQ